MGISPRAQFIGSAVFIIAALAAVIIGLTLGLRTPPLPNGGSPPGPTTFSPGLDTSETPVRPNPPSESDFYRFAAVTSETRVCSKIGSEILGRYKGSAVDAAIAMTFCVGVVNPQSSGVGGGHFMTIYMPIKGSTEKEITTILAREVAPLAATEDMFVNRTGASVVGGLSIAVPSEVAGLYSAWKEYGQVKWNDLLQPSIDLLEEGFAVERALASRLILEEKNVRATPNLRDLYVKDDGSLLKEGDMFKDPLLAGTLTKIANDPEGFYRGSLAKDIVADIQDAGGIITLEDLSNYTVRHQGAVAGRLDSLNLTVYGPPLPSSGVLLQYILRLFDGYKDRNIDTVNDAILVYHRIVEIFKFAYAQRSALGDELFVNLTETVANLTCREFIDSIRSRITDEWTHDPSYYGGSFEVTNHGTGHLAVSSGDGSTVAVTTTINQYFGSLVRGNRTGILFNDEMDDFSSPGSSNDNDVPPSPTNFIEPGKMPMSSMTPAIVLDDDGKVVMATGGTGGTKITTAVAFVALHNLYFNKTLSASTDAPRLHHQLIPNELLHEPTFPIDILDGLEKKGHDLKLKDFLAVVGSIGNACSSDCTGYDCFDRKCINAVSDGRKGGGPDGF